MKGHKVIRNTHLVLGFFFNLRDMGLETFILVGGNETDSYNWA